MNGSTKYFSGSASKATNHYLIDALITLGLGVTVVKKLSIIPLTDVEFKTAGQRDQVKRFLLEQMNHIIHFKLNPENMSEVVPAKVYFENHVGCSQDWNHTIVPGVDAIVYDLGEVALAKFNLKRTPPQLDNLSTSDHR